MIPAAAVRLPAGRPFAAPAPRVRCPPWAAPPPLPVPPALRDHHATPPVFAFGSLTAIDTPTRQSFVYEMVGPDRVVNAVSLNSVVVQAARIVGPALAGVLIATVGVVPCFAINALTFVAMILALRGMDAGRLHAAPVAARERGAIRAGLRYVRRTPELMVPLALMGLVGTLGFNFQVVLPLLAKFSFQSGAMTYAALVSAMAVGS